VAEVGSGVVDDVKGAEDMDIDSGFGQFEKLEFCWA
jgi:hypothetical protein